MIVRNEKSNGIPAPHRSAVGEIYGFSLSWLRMKSPNVIANVLSLLRLPLAAAVVLTFDHPARYLFFGLAALTDWLDGCVARGFGKGSGIGALLDPATDKIFVGTIVLYGYAQNLLPLWGLFAFFLRDLFTVPASMGLLMTGHIKSVSLQSRWSGKVVTFFQFCALFLLLAHQWTLLPLSLWILGLCAVWSVIDYAAAGWKQLHSR